MRLVQLTLEHTKKRVFANIERITVIMENNYYKNSKGEIITGTIIEFDSDQYIIVSESIDRVMEILG